MQAIQTLMGGRKDEHGVLHVNENARGCPYCGTVEVKAYEVDGETRAAFYHAGAECCARRVTDQVRWRQQEIDTLEKELSDRQNAIRELRDNAEHALSRADAQRFSAQAEKASRNMEHVERAIAEKVKRIAGEMAGLQRRRAQLAREEVA